ncbi:hypothetical protein DL764_008357 [Monosporascus ibericus]|uniref:Uncharacterized protein n=1 Tax=Monosporascus ibericus TaxID=155417 RepID=A0A4Q4SZV5_9PEZI|nr:hypothetical protein DL764_008357 [Monosporascus ibericus]
MKIDLVSLAMLMALGGLVDAIPTPDKGRNSANGGDSGKHVQVGAGDAAHGAGGAEHGAYGDQAHRGVGVVDIASGNHHGAADVDGGKDYEKKGKQADYAKKAKEADYEKKAKDTDYEKKAKEADYAKKGQGHRL